jgi:hypothetical protein
MSSTFGFWPVRLKITGTLLARAVSIILATAGTLSMQRGRLPQLPFMKSSTSSAVVFGSTVTRLSSGTGGGFTLVHSLVMSWAPAANAPNMATAAISATGPACVTAAYDVMGFLPLGPVGPHYRRRL